jgi:hypothetical protein
MPSLMRALLTALLLTAAAGAADAPATDEGKSAPPLVIKAVNGDGESYDVVKEGDGDCAVLFVREGKVHSPRTTALIEVFSHYYEEFATDDWAPDLAIVALAPHDKVADLNDSLGRLCQRTGLECPLAALSNDITPDWNLPKDFDAVVCWVDDGKLAGTETDPQVVADVLLDN